MALTLPPDFKEFLKLLKEHNVRYLLIGGYAAGYHGYARATEDMDIWVAVHPDNAQKLVSVMEAFGLDDPSLTPELCSCKSQRSFAWVFLLCGLRSLHPFQALNLTSVIKQGLWINWMGLRST